HGFGVDKMVGLAAHLPDAAISLLPVVTHILDQGAHQGPQGSLQLFPVGLVVALTSIVVEEVQHLAKHVELLLLRRTVAEADRPRLLIAAATGEFLLCQLALTPN